MVARARGPRRGPKARWARWALGIVLALLVVWIVVSAVVVWQARRHTDDGLDALERARSQLDGGGLLRGDATDDLREAEAAFGSAHDLADGPVLAPWGVIPLVGNNVESVSALTEAAERVAGVGQRAAEASQRVLEEQPTDGPGRLELLAELEAISARAQRDLQSVDLGPDFFLAPPLGDARERFDERLGQLREAVRDAKDATAGARTLLEGPKKYLVVAANNAEMRAGSGMLLSAGVATFADGDFTLSDMQPTPDLNLPAGAVPVPEQLQNLWGFTPVSQDWRYLATTPRFDVTAPLAADMWEVATGERVDGVLVVDPVALRALVAAQGPIANGDRELAADDVVDYLLRGQYDGADINDPQIARRDQLSSVARGAIDTLTTRPWSTGDLVQQLGDAGKGRHVLAWSRDPTEQQAWKGAGISGELEADSLAVNLLNTGGNKLDQFVHVDADLDLERLDDGSYDARLRLELANEAPEGLPSYVEGPHPVTDLAAGEYQGILTVNVPGGVPTPTIVGAGPLLVAGTDGPTQAAGSLVRIPRGERREVEVRFQVPTGLENLVVEPSGRVPPIRWLVHGDGVERERFEDTRPHDVQV